MVELLIRPRESYQGLDRRKFLKELAAATMLLAYNPSLPQSFAILPADSLPQVIPYPNSNLVDTLKNLDEQISGQGRNAPDTFQAIMPILSTWAEQIYHRYMNPPPRNFNGSYHLVDGQEFQHIYEYYSNSCTNSHPLPASAFASDEDDDIYQDREQFLYRPGSRNLRSDTATLSFLTALHEKHHQIPPLIDLPTPTPRPYQARVIDFTKARGARILSYQPQNSTEGRRCFFNLGWNLEEIIAQDNSYNIASDLGINIQNFTGYRNWVNRFRELILNVNYNNQDRSLLAHLHKESKAIEIVLDIARRRGVGGTNPEMEIRSFIMRNISFDKPTPLTS